ncbi:uncharacterized protein TRAVEDRAFT_19566 [Trametes versicolor FP-101664 SS1]|uniref:uncharacterized protein n=1 Tax=Trametes versicolor (strain FP-101664) TaxID=717944 RepID=UPI0004622F8B|nr:uncharacterized protein TRAVEDRAFT_19566 [Trametes versicolor FP-101664 SS1]EIW61095.1 hypothetical protein TRAVEDRAFT_19566 [Trametes versicolor FP-101664 SS1]
MAETPAPAPTPTSISATPIPDSARHLHAILTDNVPHCSGTLAPQPRDFILYYGKDQPGRVDLSSATITELDQLESACKPATFGVNQEDVLDESYRKAGKLDVDSFSLGFNPDTAGLVEVLRSGLFSGSGENREIQAELYKLNVYGKGSFFKSHKDTPRAEHMFGSLVVVFPTPHEGGALVMRHNEHEWTFDSGKMLLDPGVPPSVAFVAFFSDVDHEVTPVVSGHRVTITYNLYFRPAPEPQASVPTTTALRLHQPSAANSCAISDALNALLVDPTFLPNGGTLGFGLRHEYPLPKTWMWGDPNPLLALEGWMKGGDAALLNALRSHGLCPVLRILYEDKDGYQDYILPTLLDHIPVVDWAAEEQVDYLMLHEFHATRMYRVDLFAKPAQDPPATGRQARQRRYVTQADEERYRPRKSATVHMLTDVTSINSIKSAFIAYGNEAGLNLVYMRICLIVDVGPAGTRDQVDVKRWAATKQNS